MKDVFNLIINAIKFIVLIFKIAIGLGCVIIGLITIGALILAIIEVFPAVGIVLAAIVISVAVYHIVLFVKDKKEEKRCNHSQKQINIK